MLIVGHSWAEALCKYDFVTPHPEYSLQFKFQRGATLDQLLPHITKTLTLNHSHVLVFGLLTEAFEKHYLHATNQSYVVIRPNSNFNLYNITSKLNQLVLTCKKINPQIQVVIMIPPVVDLNYHNNFRISQFPPYIRNLYNTLPEYDPCFINDLAVARFHELQQLRDDQWQWTEKRTFLLQHVFDNMPSITSHVTNLLHGRVNTLGKRGPLVHGFHPSSEFINLFWDNVSRAKLIDQPSNQPKPSTSKGTAITVAEGNQAVNTTTKSLPESQDTSDHANKIQVEDLARSLLTQANNKELVTETLPIIGQSSGVDPSPFMRLGPPPTKQRRIVITTANALPGAGVSIDNPEPMSLECPSQSIQPTQNQNFGPVLIPKSLLDMEKQKATMYLQGYMNGQGHDLSISNIEAQLAHYYRTQE